MKLTRRAFGVFALCVWAALLLYNAFILLSLARFRALGIANDFASVLVPLAGLVAATGVGFFRPKSDAAALVLSILLLLVGGFFLTVVLASRAG